MVAGLYLAPDLRLLLVDFTAVSTSLAGAGLADLVADLVIRPAVGAVVGATATAPNADDV